MSEEKSVPDIADGKEHQVCDCTVVVAFKEGNENSVDIEALLCALLDMAPLTSDCVLID